MQPGDEVAGRYRLEEPRGSGAMSEVWRAHDERLDRTVALKLLSAAADRARFRREARAVAALAHENVMRVFDYGEDAAGPFMALEWLPGGTLEQRLVGGPLPPAETERVARGMAAGLAHLHERGFVHRDLKPANVLFDEEGRPKLADLGLARIAAGAGTLTEAGTVLGTAAYISPEQAAGEPAGPASDVYSFGVILSRMLTGALPFAAPDAFELMRLHQTAEPPPIESLNPDAPPALAALAAAALRKDPSARPADGAALLARLGEPATVDDTQILAPVAAVAARPRRIGAVAALLVVLAAAGGGLAWAVTRPDQPAAAHRPPTTGGILATHTSHSRTRSTTQATLPPAPPTTTERHKPHRKHRQQTTTAAHTSTPAGTTAPPPTTTAPPPPPTTEANTTTEPTTTQPPPTTTTTGATTTGTTTTP